jgi:hypothetical protein
MNQMEVTIYAKGKSLDCWRAICCAAAKEQGIRLRGGRCDLYST